MNNKFRENILPHLLTLLAGFFIILFYYYPVLEGKQLLQSDMLQVIGQLNESFKYLEETGEPILWSNSTFSGMPVWRGFETNVLNGVFHFLVDVFSVPVFLTFISFAGFYLLLSVMGVSPWIAMAGSIAYAFASFNIISLEAGHVNKVFAMAFMAPVLAGVIRTFQGKYLTGLIILIISTGFQVYFWHIQISYYLLLILLFFTVAEVIKAIKAKNFRNFAVASAICIVGAVIAIGPTISTLWTMAEYAKESTRGKSELSSKKQDGLDKDYAFQWSYGKMETFTLLIPEFYGGSSSAELGKNSNTYEALLGLNVSPEQAKEYVKNMPLYWGDQPFTSGPVYLGAAVCFLFLLAFFVVKSELKWWVLGITTLSIVLAWGKNFELISDLFFYYFPLYNKFRSVTMILAIAQVTVPFLGFVALHNIVSGKVSKEEIFKGVKLSFFITGGLTLFIAILGPAFFDFVSSADKQMPPVIAQSLQEDRISAMRTDAFRSFVFIALAAGAIWLFIKGSMKKEYLFLTMIAIMLVDLFPVAKRYLDSSDFQNQKRLKEQIFAKTSIDEQILRDKDPYYRVYNLTKNPFSDAITSYHHKSIGGYSAIKLGRYQDIIDHHLSKNNMDVLNMLNAKYFIVPDQQSQTPRVQQNPNALGNAWFVDTIKYVENADAEIAALNELNPESTAIVDKRFKDLIPANVNKAESDNIALVSYHPDSLGYKSTAKETGLAVFSDVYYPEWKAYIDGKEAPVIRVNYLLRGLVIPAGDHNIEFKFLPAYFFAGEKLSLIGSILFVGAVFGLGVVIFLRKRKKEASNHEKVTEHSEA